MKNCWFCLLFVIMMFAATANADFYHWEDESGVAHITDYPPPKNLKIRDFEGSGKPAIKPAPQKEKNPEISLYTKNNCPDCDKARAFLNSRELTFTKYNTDKDEKAEAKRKEIDDSSDAPFAIINRSQIYGFSETVYERALKASTLK